MGKTQGRRNEPDRPPGEDRLKTDVTIETDDWYGLPSDPVGLCVAAAAAAFATASPHLEDGTFGHRSFEASVALTNDARIRELNRDYRDRDGSTNVLSFASLDAEEVKILPPDAPVLLGDIIVAFETVEREAIAEGKSVADHLTHMVAHGMLHLLGFDHIEDHDAVVMEELERGALAQLGIADPYRGSGPKPADGARP